jgi:predicted membrane GTPase involved in stress response
VLTNCPYLGKGTARLPCDILSEGAGNEVDWGSVGCKNLNRFDSIDKRLLTCYYYSMTDHLKKQLQNLGIHADIKAILDDAKHEKLTAAQASANIQAKIEETFDSNSANPLQILVLALQYDNFKGKMGVGKIISGSIAKGMSIQANQENGNVKGRATALLIFDGLGLKEVEEALEGEIVMVAGIDTVNIGDTITTPEYNRSLPRIKVDEPTIRMTFGVNTSPFAGKEGKLGTSRQIRERLYKELETNIALRVEDHPNSADKFIVSGRGELHLSVLIESMRREGFELEVSKPEVIFKTAAEVEMM